MRKTLTFLVVALASANLSAAGNAGLAGAYLRAGVGARAAALGNAAAALVEGPDAVYWNPAALALGRRPALGSSYAVLSLGRSYQSADLLLAWDPAAAPDWGFPEHSRSGLGAWGLGWLAFSLGNDFEGRTGDSAQYYVFGDSQSAYLLGHGRALNRWFSLGSSLKLYQRNLDRFSAAGTGLDLGMLLLLGPRLRLALTAADLFGTLRWSTGYQESLPALVRSSLSANPWSWLQLAVQVQALDGGNLVYGAGLETALFQGLYARLGWQNDGLSYGAGLRLALLALQIQLDYAYQPDPFQALAIQRIDLGIAF
jgi:hypothetical protein